MLLLSRRCEHRQVHVKKEEDLKEQELIIYCPLPKRYCDLCSLSIYLILQSILSRVLSGGGDPGISERFLIDYLTAFLSKLYTNVLFISPADGRVLICGAAAFTTSLRQCLLSALMENLCVPGISFAPSSTTSLVSGGRWTGLVVDFGESQLRITPYFEGHRLLGGRAGDRKSIYCYLSPAHVAHADRDWTTQFMPYSQVVSVASPWCR